MTPTLIATALQGETLDALCWRMLGTTEVVEQVLTLNRDLASLGSELPEGTEVILPNLTTKPTAESKIVQLWD
jgi:phage tail protein X